MMSVPELSPPVEALIQAVETADSAPALALAVRNLALRRSPLAVPQLVQVLRFNNPGAAVAAVEGLIALGSEAIPYLLANVDGFNYGARAWATRACAGIGDPRALDLLVEAALTDFALSVRRAAAKGLGNLRWEDLASPEQGPTQQTIYDTLVQVLQDPEWVVRYGAIAGLETFAQRTPAYKSQVFQTLHILGETQEIDPEPIVVERLRWALQTLTP